MIGSMAIWTFTGYSRYLKYRSSELTMLEKHLQATFKVVK